MSSAPDWGIGSYEVSAAPALVAPAAHLVELAAPATGERALDLGCGTGNATLPLLEAGAHVTAIDPSLRLLGVTADRAAEAGHHLTTEVGGAEAIPLPDGDVDLIVSNFGIIFCPDPEAAFAEMVRVLAPGGRLLYTAWLPVGPISEVAMLMRGAANAQRSADEQIPDLSGREDHAPTASDAPDAATGRSPFWHDPATFADLIPGGADAITTHPGEVVFTAESPRAWLESMGADHPMWISARSSMSEDAWAAVFDGSLDLLASHTGPGGTAAIRSEYVVVELHPTT